VKRRVSIIINPISGNGFSKRKEQLLKTYLSDNHYESDICFTEKSEGSTKIFIQRQLEKACTNFLVVGGDGTVNTVGKFLAGTEGALGVIPNGSGNGLARHLQIPTKFSESISLIDNHRVIDMDYGTVNGIPFFCTAGIGFDAEVAHIFSRQTVRGFKTYLEIILKEFARYKPEKFTIQFDGKEIRTSSFLMTFANAGQFGNNVFISPDAKIDDGLLDFCLISPFPQILAPLVGAQAMSKTINSSHFYEMTRVVEAKIIREKSGWVHFDGEPVNLPKEVEFKAIPAGIKIMQPTENMLKKPLFPGLLN